MQHAAAKPIPPVAIIDVDQILKAISKFDEMGLSHTPREFKCDSVWKRRLDATAIHAHQKTWDVDRIFGVDVLVDPTMPRNSWKLVHESQHKINYDGATTYTVTEYKVL